MLNKDGSYIIKQHIVLLFLSKLHIFDFIKYFNILNFNMVFIRYGANNYKNSAKLQSLFLKDRRKLSIYQRFKDVVFHTNGREKIQRVKWGLWGEVYFKAED